MIGNIKCQGVLAGLFFAALSQQAAYAEDLMTVYQQALENDNILSAASNQNQAVKQAGRQVTGLYYPSMDLGYDHIETNQVINRSENDVFGSGESDFPTDVLSLELTQPIFRWDYFSRRKVSKAAIRQSDYELTAAQQGLMLRSAENYLLTLAALDNQFVSKTEVDSMSQQLELAKKRLEVGLGHPAEVQESIARVEFNQSTLIESENSVVDRQEGLRVITGRPVGELVPLRENFDMVPPEPANQDEWINQALENNLTILALKAAVEAADAEYNVKKAERYPTIDFVARYNNRDSGGSLFGGGSDVDTTDLVIEGNWPVFQGGIMRAKIKEALYKKQAAEDELALVQANTRRETRNAYLGVVNSIAKARALKLSMDSQANTVKAKEKGFETGVSSNVEVLDAKRDFYFVQRDYLKVRYDYLLSLLNLKRQVGSLSPADLQMINGMLSTANEIKGDEAVQIAAVEPVSVDQSAPEEVVTAPESYPMDSVSSAVQVVGVQRPDVSAYGWILDQAPNAYTIQLASLGSAEAAEAYIQKHQLDGAHYFYARKNHKDWYYILSGNYPSMDEARREAERLSITSEPWIRQFAGIQNGRCDPEQNLDQALQKICDRAGRGVEMQPATRALAMSETKLNNEY